MSKRFRECSFDQPFLIPPSLQDWLPEGHLARFVADVADQFDLRAIYADYERKDGRGLAAYHPLMMTRLLLYAYATGRCSSRAIEAATHDDVAFRYLAADQHPDHDTIAAFRQRHLQALANLFQQGLQLSQRAGLVKLGNVSIDGTKMMANASIFQSVRYNKLTEQEQHFQSLVDRMLGEAARIDEEEDRKYGRGQPADALPAELACAESRLERIRQAKRELEEEARQKLQAAEQEREANRRPPGRPRKDAPQQPVERNRIKKSLKRARANAAQPKRHYNFTDPESRMMRDNRHMTFVQGYNAQLAVDAERQVIVAAVVTQQAIDSAMLVPMVNQTIQMTGQTPEVVTADAGYFNTQSLANPTLQTITLLIPPDSEKATRDGLPPSANRHPLAQQMRERLTQPALKALYRVRKTTVEPVIGHIKEQRGFRRFLLRGLAKVNAEWSLICLTHNLLKLFRASGHLQAA
jgi:transposase